MTIRRAVRPTCALTALLLGAAQLQGCITDSISDYGSTSIIPELLDNGAASIIESEIRASLIGDDVEIFLPITRHIDADLAGTLDITLVDFSGDRDVELGRVAQDFTQNRSRVVHSVTLPGLAADLTRIDTATIVVDWRIDLARGPLYGKKSLYAALGKLEVQLRGPTELVTGRSAPFTVIVREPDSGEPVVGAAVEGRLILPDDGELSRDPILLFAGRTDARGELLTSLELPPLPDHLAEQGTLRVAVAHGYRQVWAETSVRAVVDRRVYMSSDKTIYKPGQSVELRLLALDGTTRAPVVGEEVIFEALDGKGNKVFKSRATTDAYGVASISVPTDTRVNEGVWKFRAEVAGAKQELARPVERYILPKMRIDVVPDASYALPGDRITGIVTAMYVFGEPVANADVQIDVSTSSGLYNTSLTGRTDDKGDFAFDFELPLSVDHPSLEEGGEALILSARVTDTAYQVEEGTGGLALARAPILINALPEFGGLVAGVANTVYLLISDPLGRPLVADVAVEGLGNSVPLQTDATGVAELRFVPTSSASLTLSVSAIDGAARTHTRSIELAGSAGGGVLVRTDKAVYRIGEVATITLLVPQTAQRAYLDIYRGAEGLERRALDVVRGEAMTTLYITEAMGGLLVLDAFVLGEAGELITGSRRVLVDPEDRLEVTLSTDAATYLPGETADVSVNVRDAEGNPQVALVGLTVVNEASFLLGGEPGAGVRAFFNADPRVLPEDLQVLGQTPADLFRLADSPERERLAQLLFAAAKDYQSTLFSYNSVREELPAVTAALATVVERDVDSFLESLVPLFRDEIVTRDNAAAWVTQRAGMLIDPFGRFYHASVTAEYDHTLTLTSAGPDEHFGNADDITIESWFEWLFWGWNKNYRNGWDVDADDADGGAMNDFAMAGAPTAATDPSAEASAPGAASGSKRVRSDFRETVYVNPILITDPSGNASVRFDLADSITTWRISADASTLSGKLGSARHAMRTFQSFFVDFDVPIALTQGDVLELPAVVYNYLSTPTLVTVSLGDADWIENLSATTQQIMLQPSEVRAVKFGIRILKAGEHTLTLYGNGDGINDALVRTARVTPAGYPDDQSFSDQLSGSAAHVVTIAADAVAGGTSVEVILMPGFAAEAVQGTESMMKEPNGCFEQTTASAWPNTMIAGYLMDTGQMTDELHERAFGLVTRGYQRLLTFESPTGGYNWWGNSEPGNRILSAIMLWHTKDLERLIETDAAVRDRTLDWLLTQQNADGSWNSGDALHAGNEVLGTSKIRTTAFIAWALAHTGWADAAVQSAVAWLRTNQPDASDLYAIALVANALAKGDPNGAVTASMFARLDGLKEEREGGRVLWPIEKPSWTGGSGDVGAIETTGLVAYALMTANAYPENTEAAMRFIISNKDAVGSWYNTQATMNALRALSAAASPQGSDADGVLTVSVNGVAVTTVTVTPADGDVYRKIDLTDFVAAGDNTVSLDFAGTGALNYRLTRRVYRPVLPVATAPVSLEISYDTTTPTLGQPVTATLIATNNDIGVRDQILVRLGRAPGFVPRGEDLEALVNGGLVSRYEVRDDDVTLYLMGMAPGEARHMIIRLTPTLVIEGSAPPSSIYPYYEPTAKQTLEPQLFTVSP